MALLPSNISRPRTTASTKKPPLERDILQAERHLLCGAQPSNSELSSAFFGLFLFVSLAQQSCPHYRDLGRGSGSSSVPHDLAFPECGKIAHPHRILKNGKWRDEREQGGILPQSHKTKQVFRMSLLLFKKGKSGCWRSAILGNKGKNVSPFRENSSLPRI